MKGMHGVCLHPGKAYVELKVRVYNRTPLVQTFLWWANVATRVHEAYQSFFPPDTGHVFDHAKRALSEYPLAKGFYYGVQYGARGRRGVPRDEVPLKFVPEHCKSSRDESFSRQAHHNGDGGWAHYRPNDLSFYANIPTPCSYMCAGTRQDFFGGYDHFRQAGLIHIANHHISPGKKQWTWGNHAFGYAWDRNLTDPDNRGEHAPYIELMAGVYTDNQPDFSFLQPGETKTWSQFWYPIQKIGPARHANLDAAISLQIHRAGNRSVARLGVAVTRTYERASVILLAGRQRVARFKRPLAPSRPLVKHVPLPRGTKETDLHLEVTTRDGHQVISYSPQPRARGNAPPIATEPLAPANVPTADELYLTGLHLEQYRHPTRCPTAYWREALRRDPLDARCNNALGLWHLRRGEFEQAEQHFRRAIARLTLRNPNPYDGEPYYNLGLCLRYRLDAKPRPDVESLEFADAYAAFYKATWNHAGRRLVTTPSRKWIAGAVIGRRRWTTLIARRGSTPTTCARAISRCSCSVAWGLRTKPRRCSGTRAPLIPWTGGLDDWPGRTSPAMRKPCWTLFMTSREQACTGRPWT